VLTAGNFVAYHESRAALIKAKLEMEAECEIQLRVRDELKRIVALDEQKRKVLMARKHVEEEILQMKCPRASCRKAFFDFDGCFALKYAQTPQVRPNLCLDPFKFDLYECLRPFCVYVCMCVYAYVCDAGAATVRAGSAGGA